MNQWALVIFTIFSTLAARALVSWLIERYTDTTTAGTASQFDADLGEAGSGDTRIEIFEVGAGKGRK